MINVAVIQSGAAVQLKAVMASSATGKPVPQTTSQLCRRWRCLVAVNGDHFSPDGRPLGALVSDGQALVPMPVPPVPAHWQLSVGPRHRLSVATAPVQGARQSTGASYPLLLHGRAQDILEKTTFTLGRHPRTLIGWNSAGQTIIATVDGRSARSRGITLAEGAALMLALGATDAVNLDGGGSTTFVVSGRVVNRPSDGRERAVANAWVVVPKPSVRNALPSARDARDQEVAIASDDSLALRGFLVLAEPAKKPPESFWAALALLLLVSVLQAHYFSWRGSQPAFRRLGRVPARSRHG